jgi:hypothetical protein
MFISIINQQKKKCEKEWKDLEPNPDTNQPQNFFPVLFPATNQTRLRVKIQSLSVQLPFATRAAGGA